MSYVVGALNVRKTTGRMVALMAGSGLPLRRYGRAIMVYTTSAFGPMPGIVYDWHLNTPVRFRQRQVDHAVADGAVEVTGDLVVLTAAGREAACECLAIWGREIDDYFGPHGK